MRVAEQDAAPRGTLLHGCDAPSIPPKASGPDNKGAQGVTVVVPTLNRGGFLLDCLNDLLAQTQRPLEILVVDQSPETPENVLEVARCHAAVVSYHRVGFRGLPEARNFGWQNARHDAIVFVDDDVRMGPDFVGEHLRALRLPNVGLVGGGIDALNPTPDTGPPTGRYDRWTATPRQGFAAHDEHAADHAQGCNFSAWRRALAAAGGVDEALNVGAALYEELDVCLRVGEAGYGVYFNGHARLTHLAAPGGGCRVEKVKPYLFGLARNRTVMILRHGRWYHAPVALARLLLLCASYTVHYRAPAAFLAGIAGIFNGGRAARRAPLCMVRTPAAPVSE